MSRSIITGGPITVPKMPVAGGVFTGDVGFGANTISGTGSIHAGNAYAGGVITTNMETTYFDGPITIGTAYNLKANNGSATQVSVTADEVVLKNATGDAYLATSVTETAAITSAGAGGRDTGAEANSTWYYVWLIYNSSTDDLAAMFSISATAPTMPAGYTYKALVSCVYNNSSGDFVTYYQRGNRISYNVRQAALTDGAATSYTAVAVGAFVPAIASHISLLIRVQVVSTSGAMSNAAMVGSTSGNVILAATTYANATSDVGFDAISGDMPYVTSNIYYANNGSVGATKYIDIYVLGFTLPGGGN